MYFYIPQHSWGLVENPNNHVQGFYSAPGAGCRPVALWCNNTNRGAFAHWDDANLITENLIDWLSDGNNAANQIEFYTTVDNVDDVRDRLNELANNTQQANDIGAGIWGFDFQNDRQPIEVNQIPDDHQINVPENWSRYWDGAPDWQQGSTFEAEFILAVNGFFANYNGHYYFDF